MFLDEQVLKDISDIGLTKSRDFPLTLIVLLSKEEKYSYKITSILFSYNLSLNINISSKKKKNQTRSPSGKDESQEF